MLFEYEKQQDDELNLKVGEVISEVKVVGGHERTHLSYVELWPNSTHIPPMPADIPSTHSTTDG